MAFARCRLGLVSLVVLAAASLARAQCPGAFDGGVLPPTCVGSPSSGTVRFCFGSGCAGAGTVTEIVVPPPFTVTGLRLETPAGAVPVGGPPITVLPFNRLAIDVQAVLGAPGTAREDLALRVADGSIELARKKGPGKGNDKGKRGGDDDDGGADVAAEATCRTALEASVPSCAGGDGPCGGLTCVAGACVPVPGGGPCDDGDACTVGDTCQDGVCRPGAPLACGGDPCVGGAQCVGGQCVGGTPVSCDDGVSCTADACAPGLGCVHTPDDGACATGDPCRPGRCTPQGCVVQMADAGACDDGDGCTTDDRCSAGQCRGRTRSCDDGVACTLDRCVAGACVHQPLDARCDGGACTAGACRPGTPGADDHGCVSVVVAEGEACTDDGIACTDDVCTSGGCLHVPVDAVCAAGTGDACVLAACAPARADRDATGCVVTGVADGAECSEDGDPCSNDVCSDGTCRHAAVVDAELCAPIVGPYRKALGLANAARTLARMAAESRLAGAGGAAAASTLGDRLLRLEESLSTAARVLAGKVVPDPPRYGPLDPTSAQSRARAALRVLRRAPKQAQAVRRLAATPGLRKAVGAPMAKDLRRRGRLLLKGTKSLKGDLRRIQRFSETFAR